MDEGISVNAFDGARQRHGIFGLSSAALRSCDAKDRPQSFSTGEQAIPHRLMDCLGFNLWFRQVRFQRRIHHLLAGG